MMIDASRRKFLAALGLNAMLPAGKMLGQENDLARVVGEMFHNMKNSYELFDVKPLNLVFLRQGRLGNASYDGTRLTNGLPQPGNQNVARNGPTLGEFAISLTKILRASEAGNDPLADVAA